MQPPFVLTTSGTVSAPWIPLFSSWMSDEVEVQQAALRPLVLQ